MYSFINCFSITSLVSNHASYAPVKLHCPIPPPRAPRGHHFFGGCPGVLITLFLPCPALDKHSNHSFFQCPAFFITHIFPLTLGQPRGEEVEQLDRRFSMV